MTQVSTSQAVERGRDLHLVETMASNGGLAVGARDVEPDLEAATRAAAEFLTALGVPPLSEGMRRTPARMAKAYAEMLSPQFFDLTTFPNDEAYDELLVARSLPSNQFANTTCCPSLAWHTLGTSKTANPRAVEICASGRDVRQTTPDAGTTDAADR